MMSTTALQNAVVETYRRRARRYDLTANSYYLIGFREWSYRKQAVAALQLRPGDTVVELGCGTGLNFSLLQDKIGPAGKIIGVDLTDAMLAEARKRVESNGWTNVGLIRADAATYAFPSPVDGILTTFAVSLSPDAAQAIEHASAALAPTRRLVVLDLKKANWLPDWLVPALLPIVKPFAVTADVIARRPWASIWDAMQCCLTNTTYEERYAGFAFLATGEKAGPNPYCERDRSSADTATE